MGNQDRFVALMERDLDMLQGLIFATMEHIESDSRYQTGTYAKALMKELTLINGFRELSFVDDDLLHAVVAEAATRIPVVKQRVSGRSSNRVRLAAT